jgi:hypothetical protein
VQGRDHDEDENTNKENKNKMSENKKESIEQNAEDNCAANLSRDIIVEN